MPGSDQGSPRLQPIHFPDLRLLSVSLSLLHRRLLHRDESWTRHEQQPGSGRRGRSDLPAGLWAPGGGGEEVRKQRALSNPTGISFDSGLPLLPCRLAGYCTRHVRRWPMAFPTHPAMHVGQQGPKLSSQAPPTIRRITVHHMATNTWPSPRLRRIQVGGGTKRETRHGAEWMGWLRHKGGRPRTLRPSSVSAVLRASSSHACGCAAGERTNCSSARANAQVRFCFFFLPLPVWQSMTP